MLDMEMGSQEYQLTETSPGVYSQLTPALVMVGHWGLSFNVTPKGGQPFTAVVVDQGRPDDRRPPRRVARSPSPLGAVAAAVALVLLGSAI